MAYLSKRIKGVMTGVGPNAVMTVKTATIECSATSSHKAHSTQGNQRGPDHHAHHCVKI